VTTPLGELVGERDPDAHDPAERLRHRTRQRDVLSVDSLREDDDVLVVWKEDHAAALESGEVAGRREARRDAPARDRHVRDVEGAFDERDTWVFDAVLLDVEVRRDRGGVVDPESD